MAKKKKKKVTKKNNTRKKSSNKKKKVSSSVKRKNTVSVSKSNNSKNKTKKSNDELNLKQKSKNNNVLEKKQITTKTKDHSKLKKILIVLSVVAILIVFFVVFILNNNLKSVDNSDNLSKINIDEYLELYNKEGLQFVYLYHNSCINCNDYEAKLNKLQTEFKININKFDYSKLNNKDMDILKASNSFIEDKIAVPIMIAIKDGNGIGSISGIKEYSALKTFVSFSMKQNYAKTFNKIDVDKYLSLLDAKERSLIYICDSSENCTSFSTVLDSVAGKRNIKVNFLNTDNIISSDDWDSLENSNKIFSKMWFMPALIVVEKGKVVDYKMETLDEKKIIKFLDKNGF